MSLYPAYFAFQSVHTYSTTQLPRFSDQQVQKWVKTGKKYEPPGRRLTVTTLRRVAATHAQWRGGQVTSRMRYFC